MQVSTELVGAIVGVILTLTVVVGTLGWLLRGSFQDQREAAREFLSLITENRKENVEDRAARKSLEDEVDLARAERRQDRERIAQLESDAKLAQSEAKLARESAQASTAALNELRRVDAKREAEKKALEQTITERDERIERLDKRVATLEQERDGLQKERTDLKAEVERLRCAAEERDDLAVQVAELQRQMDKLEKRGTGPLPDLAEAVPAQPEAGEEPTETQAETPEGARE